MVSLLMVSVVLASAEADGGVELVDAGLQSTVAEDSRLQASNASDLVGGVTTNENAFTLSGAAEAHYQWNFNEPSNGITAWRGFDNRHNTFTISNVMLDVQWDYEGVVGRVALQIGSTPSSYYLAEPGRSGAAGVNGTGSELWKYVQQGFVGYRFPVKRGLVVQAGVFLSPIGPEGIAVRDNWHWSRSTLFFALPYYHTGARASLQLTERWAFTLAGYNGWNSVVDNNPEKSVSLQATYAVPNELAVSLLYFGGVEREEGALEGRAWRHLLDAHAIRLAVGARERRARAERSGGLRVVWRCARRALHHQAVVVRGAARRRAARAPRRCRGDLLRHRSRGLGDRHHRGGATPARFVPPRVPARHGQRADLLPRQGAG